jgi:putative transposase
VAQRGGALPAFEELEEIRVEAGLPVRRFLRRLGIPSSTWYHWRAVSLRGRVVRRWPAPLVDAIEEPAAEQAHRWSAWGHRKIRAMLLADGVSVSDSSVERALRRRGLLQPVRNQTERRQLARSRHETFWDPPDRRNRVWQTDFTDFETTAHGTWHVQGVVDYVAKLCLAAPISGTQTAADAIVAVELAIVCAEELLGFPLIEDCIDEETGEIHPLVIVTDNGPAFKSTTFMRFHVPPRAPTRPDPASRPRDQRRDRAVQPVAEVRAPVPGGDRRRRGARRGGRGLPRRLQPDQASRGPRVRHADVPVPHGAQPISGAKCPRHLTRDTRDYYSMHAKFYQAQTNNRNAIPAIPTARQVQGSGRLLGFDPQPSTTKELAPPLPCR